MYLVTLNCFSEAESASIRSASKFCFDLDGRKNFQLFQKIFFRSIQSWGHDFFGEISNPQGISLRFPLCNNMLLHNGNLKEIPWGFEISPKKSCPQLWIDRKNIFWKSWKFFRPSRSKQNLLADRMEALSASEKQFKVTRYMSYFFWVNYPLRDLRLANLLYRTGWNADTDTALLGPQTLLGGSIHQQVRGDTT